MGALAAREAFTPEQLSEAKTVVAASRTSLRDQLKQGEAANLGDGVLGAFISQNVLGAKQVRQSGPSISM